MGYANNSRVHSFSCRCPVTIIDFLRADHPAVLSSQMRSWTQRPDADNSAMITDFARRTIISASDVWSVWHKRDAHDSSLKAAAKPVKDWEHKTKDCMHWFNAYLNLPAIMLSSVSAKRQSQLITITSLKNGSDCSILSAGFSAKITRRCVRIKGAMNGAKYKQIIEDSLLYTLDWCSFLLLCMFCLNNYLEHSTRSIQE